MTSCIKMSGLRIHFWAGLCSVLYWKITVSCVLLLCGPIWSGGFWSLSCLETCRYQLSTLIHLFDSVRIKYAWAGDQQSPNGLMQFDSSGLNWQKPHFWYAVRLLFSTIPEPPSKERIEKLLKSSLQKSAASNRRPSKTPKLVATSLLYTLGGLLPIELRLCLTVERFNSLPEDTDIAIHLITSQLQ